ncbi:hypothetical protein LSCM1_01018 [Leishmania martiniquensis]|uniref:Ubiquitin-like domain-containing protein n=1 Tax=Leishmania martiniquensis TaxID=1580590 RepID=A0A836GXC0_9TRYP|nr:hypothetical protein LSCM1_01018 [Leishmania martiniquensis]
MKLQPRERRPRSDYIVDNAAALNLGKLYLGWGRSKARSRRKRATFAAQSKSKAAATSASMSPQVSKKAAPTSPRTPSKKVPAKPAAPAPRVVKRPPGSPRKTLPPAVPVTSAAAKGKRYRSPAATPAKAARKSATHKNRCPAVKPISSKVVVAAAAAAAAAAAVRSAGAKAPPKPLPRAPRKTPVQQRRRVSSNAPPVIPNPVPTPALSLGETEEAVDNGGVTVLVRTMNGASFSLACTCESTLYDLKRRIHEIILAWTASASPGAVARLPMLVLNGRALGPDNATLAALHFSSKSTVYCFPEPN